MLAPALSYKRVNLARNSGKCGHTDGLAQHRAQRSRPCVMQGDEEGSELQQAVGRQVSKKSASRALPL